MPYGNIYWYFSSARLDFALLVDRQMQQGKCRIGICRDISVFAFAIIGGGWQFGLGVIILSIHLIIAYFREFSDWGAGDVFPVENRPVRGQAAVLLQAAVIWTAIT